MGGGIEIQWIFVFRIMAMTLVNLAENYLSIEDSGLTRWSVSSHRQFTEFSVGCNLNPCVVNQKDFKS